MKKLNDDEDALPRRRPHLMGPAAQAKALAEATAKLAARRQRDALPHRIETPRLVLRAPIRGDVPDLVKLADNKAIYEVLARLPHPYTRADGIAFVEIYAQRPDERPYAITLKDQFVGVVGLTFRPDSPPELGYWLGEPYWGKGLMSEAVKGILEAAFATHLFPNIKSRALKTNLRSQRVLEKAGFIKTHEAPDTVGNVVGKDAVFYMLEQPKWS
ncbi:MAG: ribosomal protein acetyltransferase [Devosia sp.]|uniref:GNAT family N-acetyltransferase n=1 Tax=Devosia sp. TaxID=1871048 RepID=UPI00261C88BE|nr:GNAT family N-acetyltransferase [Devosia sp.]MDB5539041.1 ribosomal protein acetyltransferase [Devosia sp.]